LEPQKRITVVRVVERWERELSPLGRMEGERRKKKMGGGLTGDPGDYLNSETNRGKFLKDAWKYISWQTLDESWGEEMF